MLSTGTRVAAAVPRPKCILLPDRVAPAALEKRVGAGAPPPPTASACPRSASQPGAGKEAAGPPANMTLTASGRCDEPPAAFDIRGEGRRRASMQRARQAGFTLLTDRNAPTGVVPGDPVRRLARGGDGHRTAAGAVPPRRRGRGTGARGRRVLARSDSAGGRAPGRRGAAAKRRPAGPEQRRGAPVTDSLGWRR